MRSPRSTSTLQMLRNFSADIPTSTRSAEDYQQILASLSNQLPFAQFAIARTTPNGDLPADQYYASKQFPIFNPKTLEISLSTQESQIEPLNQILMAPCIFNHETIGILLAHRLSGSNENPSESSWKDTERMLIEVMAHELARNLAPSQPGLTLQPNLKNKSRGFSSPAPTIIGQSEKLKTILAMIDRVAPTMASVLILGESGTGKELIARRIHALSERKDHSFVAINCGAITENLLESELFGHEKGSFTGASVQKKGLVEIADGGTLFLDEIGEMALFLQAKLLRFLQEGEFYRVGGKEPLHVSVRIISATNRDLDAEVNAGRFREDLFYRLNTISLKAPALRERKEDLPALIEYFSPGTLRLLSQDAMNALKNYSWQGNIRELQNLVERVRILSGGNPIGLQDLPAHIRHIQTTKDMNFNVPPPIEMTLDELERVHILRCLNHFEGNKTRAAQSLGITIKTLYNKLHRYGILDKTEANL